MLLTLYNQYFENKFQERFIINKEKSISKHLYFFIKVNFINSSSLFWILHSYF